MIAISNTLTAPIRCKLRYCDGRKLSSADHGPLVAMQQIADWLKELGMSEYAERFVENRIDLSVLPDLMDQDLAKMGVLLGDRRKMLRAIRDLGSLCSRGDRASSAMTEQTNTIFYIDTILFCLRHNEQQNVAPHSLGEQRNDSLKISIGRRLDHRRLGSM